MTLRLFLEDQSARMMTATVISADESGIVLDRTIFYARSGGQPGDSGVLRWTGGDVAVIDTLKGDGETILHVPAPGAALPPIGAEEEGMLDWERRHTLMRMHTALHLLCAALPGIAVTGGQIGTDKSRLDLDIAEPPDRAALELRLNEFIAGDHPVAFLWVEESVLDSDPGLVRTLSVKPPRGTGRLRLLRIGSVAEPVDLQPCGGTHVARTGEIGRVVITKIENKGRQNRRIVLQFASTGDTP